MPKKKTENRQIEWAKNLLKKIIKGDYDDEVDGPAVWFTAVNTDTNVSSFYIWRVDKEELLRRRMKETSQGKEFHFYDGRHITPFRQFCSHKILEQGEREATFYNFKQTSLMSVKEEIDMLGSGSPPQPVITSHRAEAEPKGKINTISLEQLSDNRPLEFTLQMNESFVAESLKDEDICIIDSVMKTVSNKAVPLEKLTIEALRKGIETLLENGHNPEKIILSLPAGGFTQILDEIRKTNPRVNKDGFELIESVFGVKTIHNGSLSDIPFSVERPKPETFWQRFFRVMLFKKPPKHRVGIRTNLAFLFVDKVTVGLVTSPQLTMEAQRRSETQQMNISGTHRISSVILGQDSFVPILYGVKNNDTK